ncbi:hypothetical protein [Streptomyces sp. 2R]|uniref:hypothetical protein n=1 Tax=Streptomyces sp. 2R TaxID=1883452 RepID=UPI000B91BC2E|nr:hypothetical protein [Streptomyces sp. 2R]OXY97817.1 hypothetical protein BEH93_32570 [Streptomyces sp. 2R]
MPHPSSFVESRPYVYDFTCTCGTHSRAVSSSAAAERQRRSHMKSRHNINANPSRLARAERASGDRIRRNNR